MYDVIRGVRSPNAHNYINLIKSSNHTHMGSLKDKTSPEEGEDPLVTPVETPKDAVSATPYLTVLLKYASPL
jgi:hypothetical protein